MGRLIELSGKTFHRLTVLCRDGSDKDKNATWRCLCACGRETVVAGVSLRTGNTKSCGCLNHDRIVERNISRRTHGMKGTRIYGIWASMHQRCNNDKHAHYHSYGGRGIKVCREWHSFDVFLSDMGPTYSDELTLDRIDNNGDYAPNNCRWATHSDQCNNTRVNRSVTCNGETKTLAQWARASGISQDTLRRRLILGWEPCRAISQPVRPNRRGGQVCQ